VSKLASSSSPNPSGTPALELRDPYLAAFLAWLIPGAGHWYQGRRSKAVLFFFCILGTFLYGLWLGEGRVVYAAWGPSAEEKRLPYFCQVGVGAVALPALYQAKQPPPAPGKDGFWDTFMVPPQLNVRSHDHGDELDQLNYRLNRRFELGTVYTMVAGLLNLLVIFDAFGGPAYGVGRRKEDEESSGEEKSPQAVAPSK
jgi:hypothetical protein